MHTMEELRKRRKETGMTYQLISEKSGVPVPTLQKLFSGTTRFPRFDTLEKISAVLFPEAGMPGESRAEPAVQTAGGPDLVRDGNAAYRAERKYPELVVSNDLPGPDAWRELLKKPQGTFTVSDYEQIPEWERYELIDGVLIKLESPTVEHQQIVVFLTIQFSRFAEEENCDCLVLCAPCDVQLDCDERTMVQPDVLVICDERRVTKKRGVGAPDLCIEILSPSTRLKDMLLKKYKYERAGVREFWVVDPETERVTVYDFEHGVAERTYSFDDRVPVGICGGTHAVDFSKRQPAFLRRRENRT